MSIQHSNKAKPQMAGRQANGNPAFNQSLVSNCSEQANDSAAFSQGEASNCRGGKPMTIQHSTKAVLRMQAKNSKKEDKLLFEILGKEISVFYNDTANTVSFKEGKFFDFDSFNLMVIENSNSRPTIIPRGKCIRIEQISTAPALPEAKELPFAKQKPNQQTITGGAKIATPAR